MQSHFCAAYRLKLLDLRIVTSASVSCIMRSSQVYVGFSLHCSTPSTFQRVLAGVRAAADEFGHSVEEFPDFVYLGLKAASNLNSFECWLKRRSFYDEDFKLCCHLDQATAVCGLSTTMVPNNTTRFGVVRSGCWQFFPPPCHSQDIQAAAEPPTSTVVVAVVHPPDVPACAVWEPTQVEYQRLFPTVYLTPLLVGPHSERLAQRTSSYVVGPYLFVADRCRWFGGRALAAAFADCPCDFTVDIKVLPIALTTDIGKVRLVREIFALEQCRNCCPHVIRIVDMFMGSASDDCLHLVFEAWGIPMDQFRAVRGYDRYDAQPSHHLRQCLLHIGSALCYLHWRLGLVHASVRPDCVLVTEDPDSLSRRVSCRLSGFTSLEEASTFHSSVHRISFCAFAGPKPAVFCCGPADPTRSNSLPAWPSCLTVLVRRAWPTHDICCSPRSQYEVFRRPGLSGRDNYFLRDSLE